MQPTMDTETLIFINETNLNEEIKTFLACLVLDGHEVAIFDSRSELIFSKDFRWIRECDNGAYYAELLTQIPRGMKVAIVRKDLIQDLSYENDADQIREMKMDLEDQDETVDN